MADDVKGTEADRAALETAITCAAQVIGGMIDAHQDANAIAAARSALFVVDERIAKAVKRQAGVAAARRPARRKGIRFAVRGSAAPRIGFSP